MNRTGTLSACARVLRSCGWTVGDSVATRERFGCREWISREGHYRVTLPDGAVIQGTQPSAGIAAMECANLSFDLGDRSLGC